MMTSISVADLYGIQNNRPQQSKLPPHTNPVIMLPKFFKADYLMLELMPDYDELTSALKESNSAFEAAQLHGLICGLITALAENAITAWNKQLGQMATSPSNLLSEMFNVSYQQLTTFSLEFNLLQAPDESDINLRTETLGLWCQGFIIGLKPAQPRLDKLPPGEAKESVDDIINISTVSFGDIEANEENEIAYTELVEYIRLAVLMIYQELNPAIFKKTTRQNLH